MTVTPSFNGTQFFNSGKYVYAADLNAGNAYAIAQGAAQALTAAVSLYQPKLGFTPIQLAMDNIVERGADPTGVADSTAAIRASAATGLTVYIPPGTYRVSDAITLAPGQYIVGEGRTRSILQVPTTFNPSALGVLIFQATTDTGSCLRDMGIAFDQPDITVRSAAIQYPPAIYAQGVPRFQINRIRVSGAWDGIDMRGNSGGAFIGDVEMGALNIGLNVLGSLDFVHVVNWHFWCFGFGATTVTDVFQDGNTYSAKVGGTTSFVASGYSVFSGRTAAVPDGSGVANYMTMSGVQLDTGSTIEINNAASHVQIGPVYYSGSAASTISAFSVSAGLLVVCGLDGDTGLSADVISVTGGIAQFHGGRIYNNNPDYSAAHVTGGLLVLDGVTMFPAASSNDMVPFVRQTGSSGALHMSNTHWEPTGAYTATAVSIATDNQENYIANNNIRNWFYSFPTGAYLGTYGPNKLLTPISFTPTITFANGSGTFAPAYALEGGYYWYDNAGVHFQMDIECTLNSYAGASGGVFIAGLPFPATQATIPLSQISVTQFSGLMLSTNYTGVAGLYVPGQGIQLLQSGSAVPKIGMGVANFPSGATIELHISGFIPL